MIYLVVTSILWSFSFGVINAQLKGMDPILVSLIRLLLSLLVFIPLIRPQRVSVAIPLMFTGLIQFGVMYCLYIAAYRTLAGHQVALLTITTPLFVVMIDAFMRRRWVRSYWLAALLAVIAAFVIQMNDTSWRASLEGVLLLQAANLCFAAGQIAYRSLKPKISGPERSAFGWLYVGAVIAPLAFLLSSGKAVVLPVAWETWAALAYLGLIPSGLGFFLWNKGVVRVNVGTAAAMNNLKAPLGVLVSWLVFQEAVFWPTLLVGGSLLLIAVWLTEN